MQSPTESYASLSKINNISQIAYDTLFTNYIITNLSGSDKLTELDSTDQESIVTKRLGSLAIPGLIYTFIYTAEMSESIQITISQNKHASYIDHVPLVFCLSAYNKDNFTGINLNTLPAQERLKFLEQYYQLYKAFFERVEVKTENYILTINKKFMELSKSGNGQKMVKAFGKITGSNFAYGYRKYSYEKIVEMRQLEYQQWQYIPFLDAKNAFLKLNQKQVQEAYYRNKNLNSDI